MSEKKIAHYNAILLEELKSEFRIVVEHIEGIRKSLTQRLDGLGRRMDKLEHRMDRLEYKVDMGFAENALRWQENDRRWEDNDKRWQENKKLWQENELWQRENIRFLSNIDQRLERLETKYDHHDGRLLRLEADVSALQ